MACKCHCRFHAYIISANALIMSTKRASSYSVVDVEGSIVHHPLSRRRQTFCWPATLVAVICLRSRGSSGIIIIAEAPVQSLSKILAYAYDRHTCSDPTQRDAFDSHKTYQHYYNIQNAPLINYKYTIRTEIRTYDRYGTKL